MEWDVRGLVQIVKACAASGVSQFKLEGLEITFFKNSVTITEAKQEGPSEPPSPPMEYQPVSPEDEARFREMQNEELLISDPLAYENSVLGEDNSD